MPSTPQDKLENAALQWQDDGAPYSTQFDDIYFSRGGGLAETEHVFLAGNRLIERWIDNEQSLAAALNPSATHFTVAELGFGTGLNFLCCWRAWQQLAPQHLRLHYIACEKYPLQSTALRQALLEWPELAPLSEALLNVYPDHSAGFHRLHLQGPAGAAPITLDLYYGDATQMLAAQPERAGAKVDAWFLDGFAPRLNPQMWSEELLAQLARLSRAGSTLSTYSVAGQVVRGLRAAGFEVAKVTGFAQKRQMLVGHYLPTPRPPSPIGLPKPSWLNLPAQQQPVAEVLVIGAGLAGCATAHSLARKGYRVVVLEEANSIAAGASGNRQAVLQCRLSNARNGTRGFNLQAFLYATQEFAHLSQQFPDIRWQDCGVLDLDTAFSARKERCVDVDLGHYSPHIAQRLDQLATSHMAGLGVDGASNYLTLGGWLSPAQLCHAYLQHPNITLLCNAKVQRLERDAQTWHAYSADARLASAAAVVIANSVDAAQLGQTAALPIVPIRGQVSYLRATARSAAIARVICGQSYISPALDGLHSVGASYSKNIIDLTLSEKEHQQNIEGIAPHLDNGAIAAEAIEGGRVSVRATTGDRMPIVGPVPDFTELEAHYSALGQRERKHPDTHMPYVKGLYVSVGHGSHGLSNAPLCGEYLASIIANEMLPLQGDVLECIHPGRFFLRELKRRSFSR
jgi:tRNA 5-methylaminomethyl-2-thiouridine biosynthesis bifunctional protein